MKEKFKVNPANIVCIIKASLVGVVSSIILVLLFAFILKFVNLGTSTITIVDQIIKIISILVAVFTLTKSRCDKLLLSGLITGAVYSVITFVVFSILNGGINFGVAILTDIVFSTLIGGVSAILINLTKRK